jgi:HEAT repeat protein
LSTLSSKDEVIGEAASLALAQITNKSYAQYPDDLVPRRNPHKWIQVISAYESWWQHHREKSQTDWLIEDLNSPNPLERQAAVTLLAEVGDRSAVIPLRRLLPGKLGGGAAVALANIGDMSVVPTLIERLLTSEYQSDRINGICGLERLTGLSMGFVPNGDASSRNIAIDKWKKWWEAYRRSHNPPSAPSSRE